MPTLYLSDLDGTLLHSDQRTSAYTNAAINRLVGEGMLFSYATAVPTTQPEKPLRDWMRRSR